MITIIVCYSKGNKVIGKDNKIPWHIKEDFLQFKNYTMGKTLIMGDNTFISIGKPLEGRKTIVATIKDFKYDHEDVTITHDIFEVLNRYKDSAEELVVCGGMTIYKLALPYVSKLRISELKDTYDGDAFFPDFEDDFILDSVEEREQFYIKTYLRK